MTAKEARELADQKIETNQTKELIAIEKLINNAIDKGEYCIIIPAFNSLSNSTQEQLRKLGYVVESVQTDRNEYSIKISW